MTRRPSRSCTDPDLDLPGDTPGGSLPDDAGPAGPYDAAPPDDADLWFMPQLSDDGDAPPGALPWDLAARPPEQTFTAGDWAQAEADHAGLLARAALSVGALDDRLRSGPPGLRRRLVASEVADLAWHLGDRVTVDRLALFLALRLAAVSEDTQALARAAWAHRRLDHAGLPDLADPVALAAFLGRETTAGEGNADMIARPTGTEFDALARAWALAVGGMSMRHPFVTSAAAWQNWQDSGLSGDVAAIEGAVLASKLAARALRPGGLGFVPLALAGGDALRATGAPPRRLGGWLRGIEQAALRGLMDCDRLTAWQGRAAQATAHLSGRTPERLITALVDWPLVSAPLLEQQTTASRAAVQRNMLRFQELGLVREVTGQSRFRFWRAAV